MGRGKRREQASLFPSHHAPRAFFFLVPRPPYDKKRRGLCGGAERGAMERIFRQIRDREQQKFWDLVHAYLDIFKTEIFFLRFRKNMSPSSARIVFAHPSFSSPQPLGLICNKLLVSRPRDQETRGSGDKNRNFKQWRRLRWRKCLFKSEFTLFQNLLLLFHGVQFVKCWQIFLQLKSKGLYLSLKKELEKSLSCVNVLPKTWN